MMIRKLSILSSLSALALVTACSSTPTNNADVYVPPRSNNADIYVPSTSNNQNATFGNVSRIETVSKAASTSGGGAILGAVIGGVLGHQVGGGSGRDAATVVGVVGGALAGNEVEKRSKNGSDVYRISVRLDSGRVVQFEYERIDDLRVGDRVRVQDGQVYRV